MFLWVKLCVSRFSIHQSTPHSVFLLCCHNNVEWACKCLFWKKDETIANTRKTVMCATTAKLLQSCPTLCPKKGNDKECSNYRTIALISHTSKVILKILQARLQQYVNCELPHVQAGFIKGRGMRDQIANIHWIIEKAREFQKKISISALLTMPKPLTVWITTNCVKFLKRWEYQTT